MRQTTLYMYLRVQKDDILCREDIAIPKRTTFIHKGENPLIDWDALCWSLHYPVAHPMRLDILAKETQQFNPFWIDPRCIDIPSEMGWQEPSTLRVCLKRKRYNGAIKVVSADTDARFFDFTLDPDDSSAPIRIQPSPSPKQYRQPGSENSPHIE